MMKLRVSLGKIPLLKGQRGGGGPGAEMTSTPSPPPNSHKCLTGTVEGEGKAFSHIRPVRRRGQGRDEKLRMTYEIKS